MKKLFKTKMIYGAAIISNKNNIRYFIKIKFYNNYYLRDIISLQEVVSSIQEYKVDKGIIITNASFTKAAKELAKANEIKLIDRQKIEDYRKNIISKI